MPTLDDLRALGYEVAEDDDVVAVRGFGIALSFHRAHVEIVASIANPKAHAERKAQHRRRDSPRQNALDG